MEVGEMGFGFLRGKLPVVRCDLDYHRGRPFLTSLVGLICRLCFIAPVYLICARSLCVSRHDEEVSAYFARALSHVVRTNSASLDDRSPTEGDFSHCLIPHYISSHGHSTHMHILYRYPNYFNTLILLSNPNKPFIPLFLSHLPKQSLSTHFAIFSRFIRRR
jgi:hypothetical protein